MIRFLRSMGWHDRHARSSCLIVIEMAKRAVDGT